MDTALELLDSILSNAVGVHILPATAESRARAESRVLRGGYDSLTVCVPISHDTVRALLHAAP